MGKRFRAVVFGGTGYGGGELIRRLLFHPDVELHRVVSSSAGGKLVSSAHPKLEGLTELRFSSDGGPAGAEGCDVALLAMPHKVTAEKVAPLAQTGVRIVDLSGDFRLRDVAQYETYYHTKHPCPELLDRFVYGLPELRRDEIRHARWVASPGCYATAIELALLPLARAGYLQGPIHVVGVTGSSGSGAGVIDVTHHPVRSVNVFSYRPFVHQHTPEIEQTLRDAGAKDFTLQFVPVAAPLSRGIFATCFVEVPATAREDELMALYQAQYGDAPFVRMPKDRLADVAAVAGSNMAEVSFVLGPHRGGPMRTLACYCSLDNLIKGGAGQGLQSMNLMLGVDERAGLGDPGGWP